MKFSEVLLLLLLLKPFLHADFFHSIQVFSCLLITLFVKFIKHLTGKLWTFETYMNIRGSEIMISDNFFLEFLVVVFKGQVYITFTTI